MNLKNNKLFYADVRGGGSGANTGVYIEKKYQSEKNIEKLKA